MQPAVAERFAHLARSRQLPSPGNVALEVMRLVARDDVSVGRVVRIVEVDPALVGHLIALANSVALRGREPAVSVQEAIQRLGFASVRNVVLAFAFRANRDIPRSRHFEYDRFWSHSLACAIAARAIARELRTWPPEDLFCLALLARVGGLALATLYPADYGAVVPDETGDRIPPASVLDAQRERFGFCEAELTAALLETWGLPASFVDIAQTHADPRLAADPPGRVEEGARVLGLASGLARFFLLEDARRPDVEGALRHDAHRLGLDDAALEAIAVTSADDWREWSGVLRMPAVSFPDLKQAAADAPAPDGAAAGAFTILAVDDDCVSMSVLNRILTASGYTVCTAQDGAEALDLAAKLRPQVVITDWQMPNLEGPALCHALRRLPDGEMFYLIMLTGHGTGERLAEAFAAGADDYLTKPLDRGELVARLRAAKRIVSLQQALLKESAVLRQVTSELVTANQRLEALAMTDTLTGIPNRRCVLERLEQEFARSVRAGSSLAVLAIDVDHFKQVNDTHGHDAGDAVLMETARILKAQARAGDMLGRFGGEEFVVCCPAHDAETPMAAAERLRAAVAAGRFPGELRLRLPTVSVGVAIRTAADKSVAELLARADKALYDAKRAGRNRVVLG